MKWISLNSQQFETFNCSRISLFTPAGNSRPKMAVFRKELSLVAVPKKLIAKFTGDCKFRLFINGVFVTDGPVEIGGDYNHQYAPNWWFMSSQDVSQYFIEGKNVICFELLNHPEALTDFSCGKPGIAFELYSDDNQLLLSADENWLTAINSAYLSASSFDQQKSIGNYHSPDYSTIGWTPAVVSEETALCHKNLLDLQLPPLAEKTILPIKVELPFEKRYVKNLESILSEDTATAEPLTVLPGPLSTIYLTLPQEACGHIELDISAGNGAIIEIFTEETPGCSVNHFKYITADGRQKHRFTMMTTAQHIRVLVACADFITPAAIPVQIHSIKLYSRGFPLPTTTRFNCSNPFLMQLRKTIDNTMRMCMQRMHLDSPVHQEPLGCTGDYMIESLIAQALYGDMRLSRADILRTALLVEAQDGKIFHTSYSLLYVQMVKDYFWYTADFQTLQKVYPSIKAILNRFNGYIGKEGLVTRAPNYMFIDWVVEGDITYHHPPAELGLGAMSAFYYGALQNAEDLALQLGDTLQQQLWHQQRMALGKAIHQHLWDPATKLYKAGISGISKGEPSPFYVDDSGRIGHTPYTSILAIAYGIHPIDECEELLESIMTDSSLIQPQPYFCHFLFDAICSIGKFNQWGYRLMERWRDIIDEHPSSLKECWHCGDYSHAWGGTPAYQLTRAVLGITPLVPGFRKIILAPCLNDVEFVNGDVPTPFGMIHVDYKNGELGVTLPRGVEVGELDIRNDIKLTIWHSASEAIIN